MKKTIKRIEFSLETKSSLRVTKVSETHDDPADGSAHGSRVEELAKLLRMIEVKDEKDLDELEQ